MGVLVQRSSERLKKKAQRGVTMIATVRSGHGGSASLVGSVMGTLAYMPPEQAMGRVDDLDERSDVFSLCEILTGQPPYKGDSRDVLVLAQQAALHDAQARLAGCGADKKLVALCRQCLELLPKNRLRNAGQLADEVAAWLIEVEGRAQQAELNQIEADAAAEEQRPCSRRARCRGSSDTQLRGGRSRRFVDRRERRAKCGPPDLADAQPVLRQTKNGPRINVQSQRLRWTHPARHPTASRPASLVRSGGCGQ